jgi:hypothetical protein
MPTCASRHEAAIVCKHDSGSILVDSWTILVSCELLTYLLKVLVI